MKYGQKMDAFLCDGVRTPIGRYGGALSSVRPDDLAACVIRALVERNERADWARLDDVILGCANQSGEDNRNVARMAALLAGLPEGVPGATINRLCGSGLDALGAAARAIRAGDTDFMIAGGVESMSRAPFVIPKAGTAFSRNAEIHDTTIGWRFVNPAIAAAFGAHSMPETADNVAAEWGVSREDQDAFAARSQSRYAAADAAGVFDEEIVPINISHRRDPPIVIDRDEHPRAGTTMEKLAGLKGINGAELSVTAGNASGVNDGAGALLLATEAAAEAHGLEPVARVVGMAAAGVAPRVMGIGPVPAVRRLMERTGLTLNQMDVIELNEAFAAQALAVLRDLGLPDDAANVNPNGGSIALGHPLGMSGTRLALATMRQLQRSGGRYGLCTMCVGVGQGVALIIERV